MCVVRPTAARPGRLEKARCYDLSGACSFDALSFDGSTTPHFWIVFAAGTFADALTTLPGWTEQASPPLLLPS